MTKKSLKYNALIASMEISGDCPSLTCSKPQLEAFRWVTLPVDESLNYLPNILRNQAKGRPARSHWPDDTFKCSCCGLSMFTSKEAAVHKFSSIPELNRKKLGFTHVARATITLDHGLASIPNREGHFDFFEYEDFDTVASFKLDSSL